ncbi:hypothetical protein U2F10_00805 [Leptothoe sp. EHU-05/26/07-4]
MGYVSTVFGVRRYYNGEFAENYYHRGVDYAAATGSPVVSPAEGHIQLAGRGVMASNSTATPSVLTTVRVC